MNGSSSLRNEIEYWRMAVLAASCCSSFSPTKCGCSPQVLERDRYAPLRREQHRRSTPGAAVIYDRNGTILARIASTMS
jgi:hypothetical protein